MNLSEISGKEIVNLVTGERLGVIGECDLIIDETTGSILALMIPRERGFFGLKKDKSMLEVPWRSVKKIGNDMIIIEYDGVY
ncbi:YlmC/YmxH family sporulation protein [Romboutsia maritimum]|uniref:YlmC/YmxH family sporulation protein n=1 Tax=Romboutsia maritimum TaxID=2020948 RepID=A0A371IW99_9FIRM|nr:YlmC/YmxH family sporulation protein [Romboutsia maritimum]RDY24738.1 YlmC/YmxH family sporulation protein [Romboutsia maritimum]